MQCLKKQDNKLNVGMHVSSKPPQEKNGFPLILLRGKGFSFIMSL